MSPNPSGAWAKAAAIGLVAFVVLTLRFSPNWIAFYQDYQEAITAATQPAEGLAVDKAFLSSYSERGFYVVQQARDPGVAIEDPAQKIVRWRLLFPLLGFVLQLPGWIVLGLALVGCFVLIVAFAALAFGHATDSRRALRQALSFALVAGSSAPFFTSMGWLGYYDAWLAVALLAVAFVPHRWIVVVACLLAPWIDERFVIGCPLALLIRWQCAAPQAEERWVWLKHEALAPMLLILGYSVIRLGLGGSGSSHTASDYVAVFIRPYELSIGQWLRGAWEGVRLGWPLIVAALLRGGAPGWLAAGVLLTAVAGLGTARDLSRSMVLLIPAVAFGWLVVQRFSWWHRFQFGPLLAMVAVVLPASQVVGSHAIPVEHFWSTSRLAWAQNNVGQAYARGAGLPKDAAKAARWYRKAAESGFHSAQYNLGVMYATGQGVSRDPAEAVTWFREAAAQGHPQAQSNLGVMYANGDGVAKDLTMAYSWFTLAARQGDGQAAKNLEHVRGLLSPQQVDAARARADELGARTRTAPAEL